MVYTMNEDSLHTSQMIEVDVACLQKLLNFSIISSSQFFAPWIIVSLYYIEEQGQLPSAHSKGEVTLSRAMV